MGEQACTVPSLDRGHRPNPFWPLRILVALTVWLLLAAAGGGRGFAGLELTAALERLRGEGLPVIFSSQLVKPWMRVATEPTGSSLREILDELLAPHGLRAAETTRGRLVVVTAPPTAQPEPPSPPTPATAVEQTPITVPASSDEITVTSDLSKIPVREPIGAWSLAPETVAGLPHLGDDMFRAVSVLPGTAQRESSSRFFLRGGRDDEVLILLDGLELLAPYHLQDFDSALSIVAPSTLARAEVVASGYPAEYGDRLGGVLDLTTVRPSGPHRLALGLGLLYGEASGSGAFRGERGRWHGSARGGTYALALGLDGREANPRFWDVFGKLDYDLSAGHSLRLNTLVAEDEFDLPSDSDETASYDNSWGNRYVWLTHSGLLRSKILVETVVSAGEVERDRAGQQSGTGDQFEVKDHRTLGLAGIKQAWRYEIGQGELGPRHTLEAGFEIRSLGSTVDYFNQRNLSGLLAALRSRPAAGSTRFDGRFDFDQAAIFLSDRWQLPKNLVAELGLRYDRENLTDQNQLSPRINLSFQPWRGATARLAWGYFVQSQRPNELQVEDDETMLHPPERSEHRVLDLEQRFENGGSLRLEAFEQRLSRTYARFENLFDPITVFPELEDDRVRVDLDGGRSRGLEASWRSDETRPLAGWASYTLSRLEEEVDGRYVPGATDQPHALQLGLGYRSRGGWNFQGVWRWHSGWPTTAVLGRLATGEGLSPTAQLVLGERNAERLPAYHRLDFRVGRSWKLGRSRLSVTLDLQNLYDRKNVRGYGDFTLETTPAGEVIVRSREVSFGGILPSFGIRWEL